MKINLNHYKKFCLIIALLLTLYFIFPKYDFLSSGRIFVIRCNKITGKMDYFDPFVEYKRQHLTKSYIDIANEAPVKKKSLIDIANEVPPKVK